jgi:hypothetical protein
MKRIGSPLCGEFVFSNKNIKMKKNKESFNEVQFALTGKPLLAIRKAGVCARAGKYIKALGYIVIFTGIGLLFNSCVGGYVASEPSYQEYSRPPRPSETHIWIAGDWGWDSHSRIYVQKTGYWEKPRQGHTYVDGYWKTSPQGKSWSKGHWQKDNKGHSDNHNNGNR